MITYYHELQQNTPGWLEVRLGIVTASEAKNLITPTLKVADNQTVRDMANVKLAERITGRYIETPQSKDMIRGHVEEPIAKSLYLGDIKDCGFIRSSKLGFDVGFSPDGLIGNDGFVEVKSRIPKFQIETILNDEVPSEYMAQIQMGLFVSERKYCDFIQYSNGLPLFIKRVEPIEEFQGVLERALVIFEGRIKNLNADYRSKIKDLVKTDWVDHNSKTEQDDISW
jgi:hypothetical protein